MSAPNSTPKRKWSRSNKHAVQVVPKDHTANATSSDHKPKITSPPPTEVDEREAVLVATIAAKMLPRFELPHGWQDMDRRDLLLELHMPSWVELDPIDGRDTMMPFECVAEVFVKRARVLLNMARGVKRPEEPEPWSEIERIQNNGDCTAENLKRVEELIRKKFKEENTLVSAEDFTKFALRKLDARPTDSVITEFISRNPNLVPKPIRIDERYLWIASLTFLKIQAQWKLQKETIRLAIAASFGKTGVDVKAKKAEEKRRDERNETRKLKPSDIKEENLLKKTSFNEMDNRKLTAADKKRPSKSKPRTRKTQKSSLNN